MSNQNPGGGRPWQGPGQPNQPWHGQGQPNQPWSGQANSNQSWQGQGQQNQPWQPPQGGATQSPHRGRQQPVPGQYGASGNHQGYAGPNQPGQPSFTQQGYAQQQYEPYAAGQPGGAPYYGGQAPQHPTKNSGNKLPLIIAAVVVGVLAVILVVWAATGGPDPKPEPVPSVSSSAGSKPSGERTPARTGASGGRSSVPRSEPAGTSDVSLGEGADFNLPEGWQVQNQDGSTAVLQSGPEYLITVSTQRFGSDVRTAKAAITQMAEGVERQVQELEVTKQPYDISVGSKGNAAAVAMQGNFGGQIEQRYILSATRRNDGQGVLIIAIATGSDVDEKKLEAGWKSVFDDITKNFLK